jgi:hypothetical protein
VKRAAWVIALGWLVLLPAARADERLGGEIAVQQSPFIWGLPRVVSDGLGVLVVWGGDYAPYTVYSARIDGAGVLSGPFVVHAGPEFSQQPEIATDGRTALVVWTDSSFSGVSAVKAVRLDPSGVPIDSAPVIVDTRKARSYGALNQAHVAFDGAMFRVIWLQSTGRNKVYTRRVGIDGSTSGRSRKIKVRNMASVPFEPNVGCRGVGECLLTWLETAGLDAVEGVRIRGDAIVDRDVIRFLDDARGYRIRSDGTDYMIIGTRFDAQSCASSICAQDAVAGRVSGAGVPLDPAGFRVNNRPPVDLPFIADVGLAFDGSDYVATFLDYTPPCGYNLYGARIARDGTVSNPDVPGSPLVEGSTAGSADVAATHTQALTAWEDLRPNSCANYQYGSVYAQRAMPHADASGATVAEIGAIGARTVPEQSVLRLALAASGLNPASTVFSATNLPAGAVFDAPTRAFQWKPNPDQAGLYPGVHFEASDGVQTVGEDVSITVTESSLALCGTVERLNVPVANVAVRLKRRSEKPRTVWSDANGRFCFFYMLQDLYSLSVGKPSKATYSATPLSVNMTASDKTDVLLVVRKIS